MTQPIRSLFGAALLLAGTALPGLRAGPDDFLDLLRRHASTRCTSSTSPSGRRRTRAGRWRPRWSAGPSARTRRRRSPPPARRSAMAYVGSRTLKEFAANDLIVEVPMTDEEKAAYYPHIVDTVTFDGTQWGVPIAFSTKALYWNKDLFKQAGLDPETPPKTWAEEIEMAKTDQGEDRHPGLRAVGQDLRQHDAPVPALGLHQQRPDRRRRRQHRDEQPRGARRARGLQGDGALLGGRADRLRAERGPRHLARRQGRDDPGGGGCGLPRRRGEDELGRGAAAARAGRQGRGHAAHHRQPRGLQGLGRRGEGDRVRQVHHLAGGRRSSTRAPAPPGSRRSGRRPPSTSCWPRSRSGSRSSTASSSAGRSRS